MRSQQDQAPYRQVDRAEWNQVMREETELQSVDRHFNELLQELRVAQTGVQILFAFLLGLAFTPRFPDLTGEQQGIYLVTLVLSAVSAALLIGPVGYLYYLPLLKQVADLGYKLVARNRHRLSKLLGWQSIPDDSCADGACAIPATR